EARELGALQVSMLQGEYGSQRKEIEKLLLWLQDEVKPEIINLTAVLLSGLAPELKERLRVPILASLQGDDIFLESLPPPFRAESLALIRENARASDGFVATSRYYADFMAGYLGIPRERIDVVYPGLNLAHHGRGERAPHGPPCTVGYFA